MSGDETKERLKTVSKSLQKNQEAMSAVDLKDVIQEWSDRLSRISQKPPLVQDAFNIFRLLCEADILEANSKFFLDPQFLLFDLANHRDVGSRPSLFFMQAGFETGVLGFESIDMG